MPSWNPKANELFLKALDRPPGEERRLFLDEACRDRPDLRAQVEGLLAASEKAGSFLEASPVDLSVTGEPHRSVPEQEIDPLGQNIPGGTSPPLSEGPGTRIGPYKLLEQIGEGGMGVVYMAEQMAPVRRRVALKIIKPGMDSRQVIARFEAERQALALMEHQNIARVFDAGETETGRPFFVMELVHGEPITDYCDLNRLTLSERLDLFVPVCQAVQHAHQKGIIHRDIKPSNVLVTLYDGRPIPKVIDFGIAKAIEQRLTERTLFTRYGMIVGTLQYMSPEQAEMSGLGVDTRSDIYALGVLLYELLTGSTPLEPSRLREAAYAELLQMIRELEPAKPSTRIGTSEEGLASISAQRGTEPAKLAKLLRGELDWIVMKALEKDRNRRYETAIGLAHDVERYLADEPVEACPPSAGYRLRKLARKHRMGLTIVAAFAGLLVAGLVVCALLTVKALGAERHARDEALKAGQERDRAIHAEKRAEEESALVLAMNNFLRHELLEQADPSVHANLDQKPDKDIKLRTVLDRAAGRVAGAFPDRPELEAAIRRSIGEAYRGLGEFDLARPHLEAAYEWDRQNLGAEDNATLLAQNGLAILYKSVGEYARAESLFAQALESRKRALGPEHPETLSLQTNLGTVYLAQQQFAKAEAQLLPALETRRRISGPDHPDTLVPEKFLAEVYRLWGQYGKAEPLMVHALEMHRRSLGLKHPSTLAFQGELGELYRARSEYGKAEPLLVKAAEGFRETLGADHSSTLTTEANLAGLYVAIGEHARAEKLYLQCIDAYQRKLGSDHPGTAMTRQNLAALYSAQKKFDKAEPLFLQALEVFGRKFGPDHPSTLNCESNLAMVYRNLGQVGKAETLYLKILEKRREKLGPDHPHTLVSQNNLAVLYRERGDYDKAEPLLMQTLEARRKKLGDDHPYTLNSQFNLALLYQEQGAFPKAEALLTQNLEARRRKLGAEHPDTLISLSSLADLYQARGEYAKAEPLYAPLVEIQRRKLSASDPQLAAILAQLGFNLLRQQKYAAAETPLRESLKIRAEKLPDSWMRFNTESMLGGSLLGQQKLAVAEPLLLAGYEGLKDRADKIPAQAKVHLTHAVVRIVDLYTTWGKKDKADEWRKKMK